MSQEYLDFELPIAELEAKIESLRAMTTQDNEINLDDEIARLQKKSIELTEKTFANFRCVASVKNVSSSESSLYS